MIKNFLITFCAFSFLLFLSQTANACMCAFGSLEGSFVSTEAVFIGKVIKIQKVNKARVGLLMKAASTLELINQPRWEILTSKAQNVTLEVIESFKGTTAKTFLLHSEISSCNVQYKIGESFLVFASRTQPSLSNEDAAQPMENWTTEMNLKAQADRDNAQLPPFSTTSCGRSGGLRFKNEEVEEIRTFLKNGVWKKPDPLPTRIITF